MPEETGSPLSNDTMAQAMPVPPPIPAPQSITTKSLLEEKHSLPPAEAQGEFFVYQRELAPGMKIEHYEILKVLGSGGFGITYLATDLHLNRKVVIKENFPTACSYRDPFTGKILPNNEHDRKHYEWSLKSFLTEARTLAELNHEGIVKILSVFEANDTAYFAMDYINGLSLDYLAEKLHTTGHRYTEDELKGLLIRLLHILEYLHESKIYHRDIKPGNILLTEEGVPVLIDFGAARHALNMPAATVLTTQGFSSPEQALGKSTIGPWSDLYSVGATFYTILTGELPERAEARLIEDTMPPLHSNTLLSRFYSREFLFSLDKALSPTISGRYQNAQEWIKDICPTCSNSISSTIKLSHEDIYHAQHREPSKFPPMAELPNDVPHVTTISIPEKRSIIPYLIVGCLCTLLTALGVVFLVDYMRQNPMGTTINQIKDVIQQQPVITPINPSPMLVQELSQIRIPELRTAEDASVAFRQLSQFSLNLNNSTLIKSGFPTPDLPNHLRVSCIYLQLQPILDKSTSVYLTIRDKKNKLVSRSANSVPSFNVPGLSTTGFFFSELPTLTSSEPYYYSFEDESNTVYPVNIACFKGDFIRQEDSFPTVRIVTALPIYKDKILTPSMDKLLSIFTSRNINEIEKPENVQFISQHKDEVTLFAQEGYPLAQYALANLILNDTDTSHQETNQAIVWLYRSAISGCYAAVKSMGVYLLDIPMYFPDLKAQPTLAQKNYAQASRFLKMALQYKDLRSLYLLSLMYSQGWGVPCSPSLTNQMIPYLDKSSFILSPDFLEHQQICALWLSPPLSDQKHIKLQFTIPGPNATKLLDGLTIYNTDRHKSLYIQEYHVYQENRELLHFVKPCELVPGQKTSPLGVSIPHEMISHTSLPLVVEIIMSPNNGSGIVTLPNVSYVSHH
ncbi:MAG: protein kinase [Akkermansia sp.]|nr:protein kinase [Akkermansia sp.]